MMSKMMPHIPFLLAIINTLMCYENQKITIFGYALLILTVVMLTKKELPRIIIFGLNILSLVLVFKEYKTIFDIEAGASWLILLLNLKLLETKKTRDLEVYYAMALVSSIAQVLFTQSIIGSFFYLTTTALIICGLYKLNNPLSSQSKLSDLIPVIKFFLIITPIIISSYFVFPRFELGFSLFRPSMGKSGFSPDINLKQTSEIQLSDKAVFSANFKDNLPSVNERYWIGNVLYHTDGNEWLNPAPYIMDRTIENKSKDSKPFDYQVVMQNVSSSHLFVLDIPVLKLTLPTYYELTSIKSYKLIRTHLNKITYTVQSKKYKDDIKEINLEKYLKLPRKLPLIIKETAKKIKGNSFESTLSNLNNYFIQSGFTYTLSPPPANTIDKFLDNKKGFCVHFASAYATLAREMGIPSRIVIGFQGGEQNPYDNVITIREKDSHAWVELLNEANREWVRIDPVFFVAPERITEGMSGFENKIAPEGIFNQMKKFKVLTVAINYLRHLDNRWQTFVYSFDTSFQENLANRLHIQLTHLYMLSIMIPLFFLFSLTIYLFFKNFSRVDPVTLAFKKFQGHIKDPQLKKASNEGYMEYFNRINFTDHSDIPKHLCDHFYSKGTLSQDVITQLCRDLKQYKK